MYIVYECTYAYIAAGLSTYFYGLSALLHVFLRVERGQAHNSLGTAFIRSAVGVVIVVFSLFILCCCCAHSHEERASFVVVVAVSVAWLLSSALKVCKRGGEWELERERGRVRYLCAHLNILCILDKAHLRCPATCRVNINAHAKYLTVSLKSRASQWCASH